MRVEDKVAIVTGGGHGIGRAYCRGLAKEGAKVVVADIDLAGAEETKKLVEDGGGNVLAVRVDVADEKSTLAMAESAVQAFGKIDILVNNAAIFATIPISRVSFDQVPIDEWDKLMAVNLKGIWLCCRAIVPFMKKQNSGKIVNISSGAAFSGRGMRIHYVTSKAGVLGFTKTLARELGEFNITVNSLAPGSTLSADKPDPSAMEFREKATGTRCIQRIQVPDDLVGAMIFLCSSDSDFMTGQTVVVDGGHVMI